MARDVVDDPDPYAAATTLRALAEAELRGDGSHESMLAALRAGGRSLRPMS
jgi:hypothetical protein